MDLTGAQTPGGIFVYRNALSKNRSASPERNLQPPAPLVCAAHKRWEKEFKLLRLI
jgi:hypothetical protein